MKRFNFVLILIFILSLVFMSSGNTTSIRMDELTDGSSVPPTTSWYLIGYNGTTAYRMTYLSLLGIYFDAPGDAGGILYSDGSKWTRVTELNAVTIGGFSTNSAICSDSSGNLVGCTNISGDINFAPVASPTFTGTVTLPASTSLTTPVIGIATGTSLVTSGIIDGTVNISQVGGSTSAVTVTTTYKQYYYFVTSTATIVTFTLPTPATGVQFCMKNAGFETSYTYGDSQIILDAPTGVYIDLDGQWTSSGGTIYSDTHGTNAIGAGACVVGLDTTHYIAFPVKGTWSKN